MRPTRVHATTRVTSSSQRLFDCPACGSYLTVRIGSLVGDLESRPGTTAGNPIDLTAPGKWDALNYPPDDEQTLEMLWESWGSEDEYLTSPPKRQRSSSSTSEVLNDSQVSSQSDEDDSS